MGELMISLSWMDLQMSATDSITWLPEECWRRETEMERIPRLATDRLLLRAIQPSDSESVFSVYSDPDVTALTDMGQLVSLDQAKELIARYTHWFQNDIGVRWGIFLQSTEQLIGVCCFDTYLPHYQSCSIGYDIGSDHWNQGYATEATAAICHYAFKFGLVSKIHRIQAITHAENLSSIRVLKKIGFQSEGEMRDYGFWSGAYHNMFRFSRLESDPDPGHPPPTVM